MGIVLTFVFNSGLNLVLGLAVAAALGPAEYGRYAIAFMAAIVLGTALFDWLRHATTRFIGSDEGHDQNAKASIEGAYGGLALLIVALVSVTQLFGVAADAAGVSIWLVLVAAIANARFEFRAAEARARFLDGTYVQLVLVKNGLALVLMLGAALLTHDANWVMAMMGVGCAVASLIAGRRLDAGERRSIAFGPKILTGFARYGVPIVCANLIYQVIVLLNRWAGAKWFGLADSGSLSLATDLTIRLFLSVGAALDAYLFQIAVRRRTLEGEAAAARQVADNMIVIGGILALLAIGYWAALPSLEALFVPSAYKGSFGALSAILLPGIYLFCIMQFCLSPVFQLSRGTSPLLWCAGLGLGVDIGLLALLPPASGVVGVATVHTCALAAGAIAAAIWAASTTSGFWPRRTEVLKVVVLVASVGGAMWPFRMIGQPWLSLAGACTAGAVLTIAMLLALDVMGVRDLVQRRFGRTRPRLSAASAGDAG